MLLTVKLKEIIHIVQLNEDQDNLMRLIWNTISSSKDSPHNTNLPSKPYQQESSTPRPEFCQYSDVKRDN